MTMKKMMKTINSIKEVIEKNERIYVFPHILPDGDTIGSAYALGSYLKSIGKDVTIITEDVIPSNLNAIPTHLNQSFRGENHQTEKPDVIIAVDSSDLTRMGDRRCYLGEAIPLVNIDHHKTNEHYGTFNVVDEHASSTAEIIYTMLKAWGHQLSQDEATALYIGISTDTGSFKYSNTSPKTMTLAGEIMDVGIDINSINTELYQNQPFKKIRLMLLVLDTLVVDFDKGYGRIVVTQNMLDEAGATYEDVDGLVEFVRNIEGIEVVALLKEMTSDRIKVSLRSKHQYDVSKIALAYGGGGHAKAAGCLIESSLGQAIEVIDEAIKGGA